MHSTALLAGDRRHPWRGGQDFKGTHIALEFGCQGVVPMTAEGIAKWMVEQLAKEGSLCQETAVFKIAAKFGGEFTHENENGNPAIRRDVLAPFHKLTGDSVVWEPDGRCWRMRNSHDGPGRRQH